MAGIGPPDNAVVRIVDAADHGHEHAAGRGLADFGVDPGQKPSRLVNGFAEAPVEARCLGHHQRRVHALAGNVAEIEANAAIVELEEIVEIPRHGSGRVINAGNGKFFNARNRQQGTLDFSRQFQLAGKPLLFDQRLGHAGILDGQRSGRAHRLQQVQILVDEQAVAATLVDQFDGADAFLLDAHRRAKDRPRGDARFLVHAPVEAWVLGDVADDLADAVLNATADDALIAPQRQPGDFRGTDARVTTKGLPRFVQHEERAALGIHVFGDVLDGALQGRLDVQGRGEILAHGRQQLQVVENTVLAAFNRGRAPGWVDGLTLAHGSLPARPFKRRPGPWRRHRGHPPGP